MKTLLTSISILTLVCRPGPCSTVSAQQIDTLTPAPPLDAVTVGTNTIQAVPIQNVANSSRLALPPAAVTNGQNTALVVKGVSTLRKEINLNSSGAQATFGRHKVFFPSDIASEEPIRVTTPDGRTLKFRPTYLVLANRATGASLLLGQIANRIGEIILPAQDTVRWTNVFDSGPAISIEYRYSENLLEQNILCAESFTLPEGWDASEVSIECWTEFFDSHPVAVESRSATLRTATATSAAVVGEDQTISFGVSRVVAGGKAFTIGVEEGSLPVSKSWVQVPVNGLPTRTFLIESLDFLTAKPQLDALPAVQRHAARQPASNRSEFLRMQASNAKSPEQASRLKHVGPGGVPSHDFRSRPMLTARVEENRSKAFLIDFTLLNAVPVPPGIISWWPAGGDALDAITNHNDGTLDNAAGISTGYVGQGFTFDGSSYVEVADSPSLNPTNALTFEGWVYMDHYDGNHSIFRKDGECWNRQFLLTVSPSQTFRAHVGGTNGTYYYIDSTNLVNAQTWYHVAMTYSVANSNLLLYVNGQLNSSGAVSGSILQTPETLYIGGGPNDCSEYDFPGIVDEASFYGRALSADEIQSIYNAGAAGKLNPNCVPPSTNAVGWWPGDENAFDIAHTNFAVLKNGTSFAPGVVGTAFHFDGTNACVRIQDNPDLNPTDQLTIEAWVYLDHYDLGDNFVIVRKDRDCDNRQYMLSASPDGTFRAHVGTTDSGYNYIDSATPPPVQSWCHVAETYDGTNLSLYVNGLLDATTPVTGEIVQTSEPVCIGGTDSTSCYQYFFAGLIDEPTIYDRALSDTEIASIYSAGCAGKCKIDSDADMLTELQETFLGTDPNNPDTDGDGVPDGVEFFQGRSPLISGSLSDTDNTINLQIYTPLK